MEREPIKADEYLLLIVDKKRQWLRKITPNEKFHSDRGYLDFNDVIGKESGKTYFLSSQRKIALVRPTLVDIIFNMKRSSQIIYPEDTGLIITYGNVITGNKIIEAGMGSASLTSALSRYSQPTGHVNTFELRRIAFEQAKENLKLMGLESGVTCTLGDLFEALTQLQDIDFITLDIPNTWEAVPKIKDSLSENGKVCLFTPVIEQVHKNIISLREHGFYNIIALEMFRRTFQVKPNATRPHGRMVGHSGYLTFANLQEDNPLIPPIFTGIYNPENFGNLLLYGDIHLYSKVLIVFD